MQNNRVLSGMRPTGRLHLGHYHGVLKNWLDLQNEYESYFFIADWHAFTTHYADKIDLEANVNNMVVDWLAAGIDPNTATIFVQSKVPEHAELHLLLSMITPLAWLSSVPSYKDQQAKLKDKDLTTYGFLGYPLLQSADILIYRAGLVPVGEDQVAHIELTRDIARRFNYVYGREADFEQKAEILLSKMGKKSVKIFKAGLKSYQENGDIEALAKVRALLDEQQNLTVGDRERLSGYAGGVGKIILPEPQPLLTKTAKMMGLDGQKMSKSYNNTISFRDDPIEVEQKIKKMPTDPARVKLTDKGDPEKCPVWNLHQVYSDSSVLGWVQNGCTKAEIGCVECKQPIINAVKTELSQMRENIEKYQKNPDLIKQIIFDGSQKARSIAIETIKEVREVMGITY